jgi:hypothetical protein
MFSLLPLWLALVKDGWRAPQAICFVVAKSSLLIILYDMKPFFF